uniref:Uncharacterized protein n=1 Tax=Oryza barthii TaxID=65489 RepID=A0A0D3GER3_9ORYZ
MAYVDGNWVFFSVDLRGGNAKEDSSVSSVDAAQEKGRKGRKKKNLTGEARAPSPLPFVRIGI